MQALDKVNALCKRLNIPTPLPLGSDAVLSGSFIWHILTADEKTSWTPHDLDIFCLRSAVPRMREYLLSNGFKLSFIKRFIYTPDTTNIVEEWVVSSAPDWPEMVDSGSVATLHQTHAFFRNICAENYLPPLPDTVKFAKARAPLAKRHLWKSDKPMAIQLVVADSESYSDASALIKDRFDFPTLENWFDGMILSVSYPESVANHTSLVRDRKCPNVPEGVQYDRLQDRIAKYEKVYGLTIVLPKKSVPESESDSKCEFAKIKVKLNELIRVVNNLPKNQLSSFDKKTMLLSRIEELDNNISECDAFLLQNSPLGPCVTNVSFGSGITSVQEKKARFLELKDRIVALYNTL